MYISCVYVYFCVYMYIILHNINRFTKLRMGVDKKIGYFISNEETSIVETIGDFIKVSVTVRYIFVYCRFMSLFAKNLLG